jgi:hypothetical protein
MNWLIWLAFIAVVLVIAVTSLRAIGEERWARTIQSMTDNLEAGRLAPAGAAPTHYDASEINALPLPVQRYFRAALSPGQPIVAAASIQMTGRFNMSATAEQWRPFTSQQRVIARRPGFLWDARIALLPGLTVRVVDSYTTGNGLLRAAIQGLFIMADMRGGEIARGELMRWFAEAVWYPTALLPS